MIQNLFSGHHPGNSPKYSKRSGGLIDEAKEALEGNRDIIPSTTKSSLATEDASSQELISLNEVGKSLSVAAESLGERMGVELTEAQVKAGAAGAVLAGDITLATEHISKQIESTANFHVINHSVSGEVPQTQRFIAKEAYDERSNKDAAAYAFAYNIQCARQDDFGEAFFPTVVITPEQVGLGITVNLMTVFDGIKRKSSGAVTDFQKKNIIRAVADATILRKEQTKVIPVNSSASVASFVANADVAKKTIVHEGNSIATSPYKIGTKLDIIGLSSTPNLISGGKLDQTDTLDPYIVLDHVYVKFKRTISNTATYDVVKFKVKDLPLANFVYAVQNLSRVMNLNFSTTSVLVNKKTLKVDGSDLAAINHVKDDDRIARISMSLSGSINIETGETAIYGQDFSVSKLTDATGSDLPTGGNNDILKAALNSGEIIGYTLNATKTNANRRERGDIIDITYFTQMYNVPLRSPISTIHPAHADNKDNSDVEALITATRIRTCNESVTALIGYGESLADYTDARDSSGEGPDLLGVGRFFVRSTYFDESIDMTTVVDSISSSSRYADIQQSIVNKIRDYAYRLYRDSEYKAAADAIGSGNSAPPTVIIGTDPVLARYISVSGDLRTLGGEFNVKVVSTLDTRLKNKVYITFSNSAGSAGEPHPLDFGNMVWAPELVLNANISRGNTYSKEIVVQPRYLFINHLPVLAVLTVTNVEKVLNKIALSTKEVTD